ncbi:MAG: GAF domain-containing protein [Pseudomonadota bacterium]
MMDSPATEDFDRTARLAARILETPVALVSFVDEARQFFKAQHGLVGSVAEDRGTRLDQSMCRFVVDAGEPFIVNDTANHAGLEGHAAITDLDVAAYAGVPICAPDGSVLGSFCAIDHKPRHWTDEDLATLKDLAKVVEAELALRATVAQRELVLDEMSHRIKNLFSMINGMVRIDSRRANTPLELAESLGQRISALNDAHQLIVPVVAADRVRVASTDLGALMQRLLAAHLAGPSGHLSLGGPHVNVGERSVVYMALALHEVATNAAKYGALGALDGRVSVSWRVESDAVHIHWQEQAALSPERPVPTGTGFGSRLMEMAISHQLGGRIESHRDADLYNIHITIPLDALSH